MFCFCHYYCCTVRALVGVEPPKNDHARSVGWRQQQAKSKKVLWILRKGGGKKKNGEPCHNKSKEGKGYSFPCTERWWQNMCRDERRDQQLQPTAMNAGAALFFYTLEFVKFYFWQKSKNIQIFLCFTLKISIFSHQNYQNSRQFRKFTEKRTFSWKMLH